MPFAKRYEYFEVRTMLQGAEGVVSPVTGQAAHSRILHAKSVAGSGGTQDAVMVDRTNLRPGESGRAARARGSVPTSSAFPNLLQQGSAACEALNSPTGQAGLAVFDDPAHLGSNLRLTINVPITREMGFLPASGAPSLHVSTRASTVVDKTQNTSGVRLIIDRAAAGLVMHIQTCIPLGGAAPAATWNVISKPGDVAVANG